MANWWPWSKRNEVKKTAQPRAGYFVTGARSDYDLLIGGAQLTPALLGTILAEGEAGHTSRQCELFAKIEQGTHVAAVFGRRRGNVVSKQLQMTPPDDDEKSIVAADLATEVVGRIANLKGSLQDLTSAIGHGFALSQIVWVFRDGLWEPAELEHWPHRDCILGNPNSAFEQFPDTIQVATDASRTIGEPLEHNQWVAHVAKSYTGPIARTALLRTVAWWWLFKHYSVRDFAIFVELFGHPKRVAKYHPGASDDEMAALKQAVVELGKDGSCIIPSESMLELVETKTSAGQLPHSAMIELCNAEISKAVLGGTLGTEGGAVGARSLGEVHERNESLLARADCLALAETLKRDLIRPIIEFNLGEGYPVPNVQFVFEEKKDFKAMAETDRILSKDIGLPLTKAYFYEAYGRPAPEEGEELVEMPAAPEPDPIDEEDGEEEAATAAKNMLRALSEKSRIRKVSKSWAR